MHRLEPTVFPVHSVLLGEKSPEPTGSYPPVETGGFIALLALYSII